MSQSQESHIHDYDLGWGPEVVAEGKNKSSELIAQNPDKYRVYLDGISKLSSEQHARLKNNGFDFLQDPDKYFNLFLGGKEVVIEMAVASGHKLASEKPIGKGQNKTVYLLESGKVLKVSDLDTFLHGILKNEDDLSFVAAVKNELPQDYQKVIAESVSIPGVSATIQEPILRTDKAVDLCNLAGRDDLADKILLAHKANPLAKHYVFEQKTRNSGLIRRGDSIFVVAHDYSDGLFIEDVSGGWDTIRRDMAEIVELPISLFSDIPEISRFVMGTNAS